MSFTIEEPPDEIRLDREDFARYLRELPPQATVGTAGTLCGCPLVRYLAVLYPHIGWAFAYEARVLPARWGVFTGFGWPKDRDYPAPPWAAAFAQGIDMSVPHGREVTPPQALVVLEGVPLDDRGPGTSS